MGRIFVVGTSPSGYNLYMIDPSQPPGPVTLLASNLGPDPSGIAFDGSRIWTGQPRLCLDRDARPDPSLAGHDGRRIRDDGRRALRWNRRLGDGLLGGKLPSAGLERCRCAEPSPSDRDPEVAVFDGANIWVPNFLSDTVSVVQASTGTVLATLAVPSGSRPTVAAFDGQRVLVTHYGSSAVSLWNAADFTPLGTFSTGTDTAADRHVQRRLELLDAFSTARASSRGV